MTGAAESYEMDETVPVELPNHPRDEYADIIDNYRGDFPASWTYRVVSPWDMDPAVDREEARSIAEKGVKAEAWVDLSGEHATVHLNPHCYGEPPKDTLIEEAERVLREWIINARRELGLPQQGPADTGV